MKGYEQRQGGLPRIWHAWGSALLQEAGSSSEHEKLNPCRYSTCGGGDGTPVCDRGGGEIICSEYGVAVCSL